MILEETIIVVGEVGLQKTTQDAINIVQVMQDLHCSSWH